MVGVYEATCQSVPYLWDSLGVNCVAALDQHRGGRASCVMGPQLRATAQDRLFAGCLNRIVAGWLVAESRRLRQLARMIPVGPTLPTVAQ